MKFSKIILFLLTILVSSCGGVDSNEKIAQRSCSSCHLYPEPNLLDKDSWEKHVLPRMGAWLGMGDKKLLKQDMTGYNLYGRTDAIKFIPDSPLISENDWQKIQDHYLQNAPTQILANVYPESYEDLEAKFKIELITNKNKFGIASNTMLHFASDQKRLYAGNREGEIVIYDDKFVELETKVFNSTPSAIVTSSKNDLEVLLMGQIIPNNQALGSLVNAESESSKNVLDKGLNRPVFMEKADLNNDGKEDYLISSFGYHIGKLAWYENKDERFEEHILLPIAGAIKTTIGDVNGDGLLDIIVLMTQGDESIYYLENLGKGEFKTVQWIQLPPVYGSSDYVWEDINEDGHKDFIIVSGDNGDFSLIRKPYHGIRFFINDGSNHFTERQFIPLQGATGIELADFDLDGDLDLAVIANFADFGEKPHRSFVLYDNLGDLNFEAHVTSKTDVGRWLVMEQGDFDEDGDIDLVLGSHLIKLMVSNAEWQEWQKEKINFLVLRNNHISP